MQIIVDSFFLPPIEYFCQIVNAKSIYIDKNEPFQKQSFRNRCFILGPHKVERITIPILHESKHTNIANVKLSFTEPWQRNCWRTIENCYKKSPFFEYYSPYLSDIILETPTDSLFEFNNILLKLVLKLLTINMTICHDINDDVIKKTLEYKNYGKHGIDYQAFAYRQNFGNEFAPNLSIIDLLFCKGPESLQVLKKSCRIEHKE